MCLKITKKQLFFGFKSIFVLLIIFYFIIYGNVVSVAWIKREEMFLTIFRESQPEPEKLNQHFEKSFNCNSENAEWNGTLEQVKNM